MFSSVEGNPHNSNYIQYERKLVQSTQKKTQNQEEMEMISTLVMPESVIMSANENP